MMQSVRILHRRSPRGVLSTLDGSYNRLINSPRIGQHLRYGIYQSVSAFSTSSDQQQQEPRNKALSSSIRFKSTTSKVPPATIVPDSKEEDETEVTSKYEWDLGVSKLIPEWKKMFNKDTLFTDVSAGLTVGCVAVPLSLAIAVASEVPAEVGLVTAVVSGIAGGLMGGTTLAVTGPAAAISLLVVDAVHTHGLEALPFITLACGGLQLASGVSRIGTAAKLVPVSVIAGFTTGVGTLILTGQLPKALGMSAPGGMNPVELLGYIGTNLSSIHMPSAALAVGTSAAMFMLPKVHAKIPAALVAVGGATVATHTLGLSETVTLIGALPSGLEAFTFGIPGLPPTENLPSLCATIGLIYAMTSAESLLSCAALEKMKKTDYKHSPDQELVGQGLANIGASMFMGMPVTSVIARSSLNVRLNANTRLPALVQAGFVFSSVVFLSDKIALIPMPALSGLLITTGVGMLNPTEFKHCYDVQKSDSIPFAMTIGGMLSMGLAEGIGIGCISAVALNYGNGKLKIQEILASAPQQAPQSSLTGKTVDKTNLMAHHEMMPSDMPNIADVRAVHTAQQVDGSSVWEFNGPVNFVGMFEIDNFIKNLEAAEKRNPSSRSPIVLDMGNVNNVEFTGVEEIANRLAEVMHATGKSVKMINCSFEVQSAFDIVDPSQQIERLPAASNQ